MIPFYIKYLALNVLIMGDIIEYNIEAVFDIRD